MNKGAFVVACLLAAAWPRSLELGYRLWMFQGHILGEINSRIILSLVFFGIIAPMGMARRWLGNDLSCAKSRLANTYREARDFWPASHVKRQY